MRRQTTVPGYTHTRQCLMPMALLDVIQRTAAPDVIQRTAAPDHLRSKMIESVIHRRTK